jgi:hypothetical protein
MRRWKMGVYQAAMQISATRPGLAQRHVQSGNQYGKPGPTGTCADIEQFGGTARSGTDGRRRQFTATRGQHPPIAKRSAASQQPACGFNGWIYAARCLYSTHFATCSSQSSERK